MASDPTWAIVATIDEPPALVQAFVAWHLNLGATRIHLYFDRPDDPAAEMVQDVAGVTVVRCDDTHWQSVANKRPHRHQTRQLKNATHAHQISDADWLLHCDADEFVSQGTSLGRVLATVTPDVDFVRIMNVERVHNQGEHPATIFDGFFRKPYTAQGDRGVDLFGPDFKSTSGGLTGHAVGKSLTRKGRDVKISIHKPRGHSKAENELLVPFIVRDPMLLHFDGLTALSWVYKLLRKADAVTNHDGVKPSPHRQRQLDAVVAAASDPAVAMALHDRLKSADDARKAELHWLDLSVELTFDPQPALAKVFPGQSIDLSPDAINDWYWSQKGSLMAQYGLAR